VLALSLPCRLATVADALPGVANIGLLLLRHLLSSVTYNMPYLFHLLQSDVRIHTMSSSSSISRLILSVCTSCKLIHMIQCCSHLLENNIHLNIAVNLNNLVCIAAFYCLHVVMIHL
jgi:hypothetical protein